MRQFDGHTKLVISVSISYDDHWIVSGSEDNTVRLWDVETGKQIRQFDGHTNWVWCVEISNDNKWIVSGSFDKTIRLWDVKTGKQVRQFDAGNNQLCSVVISNDSKWLCYVSSYKTIRLRNTFDIGESIKTILPLLQWQLPPYILLDVLNQLLSELNSNDYELEDEFGQYVKIDTILDIQKLINEVLKS